MPRSDPRLNKEYKLALFHFIHILVFSRVSKQRHRRECGLFCQAWAPNFLKNIGRARPFDSTGTASRNDLAVKLYSASTAVFRSRKTEEIERDLRVLVCAISSASFPKRNAT